MTFRINADGSIGSLEYRNEAAANIAALGQRSVRRVSTIEWSQKRQAFFVFFLVGPYAGRPLHRDDLTPHEQEKDSSRNHPLLFNRYEDAVAAEVRVVEEAIRKGETWPMEAARPTGLWRRLRFWFSSL